MSIPVNKLDIMKALYEDSVTKEDFVNSFANVVSMVKDMQARNEKEIKAMQTNIQLLSDKLSANTADDSKALRMAVDAGIVRLTKRIDDGIQQLDARMAEIRDGAPGKDGVSPDPKAVVKDVMKLIDFSPLWDELNTRIEEMQQKIKAIPERPVTTIFGPGKTKIVIFNLSSQLDGAKKTFFLGSHFGIVSVQSSGAPFGAFQDTTDYVQSGTQGKSITFTANVDAPSALAAGQSLLVKVLR